MINYKLIHDSIEHYSSCGFTRIESPWTVNSEVANITNPNYDFGSNYIEDPLIGNSNKTLVSSGEQSFLYLMIKGFLPQGRFQTITPCFRFNDNFNINHSKYFIKNELIVSDSHDVEEFLDVIESAFNFFSQYIRVQIVPQNYNSENSLLLYSSIHDFKNKFIEHNENNNYINKTVWDLEGYFDIDNDKNQERICHRYELGSYGFRQHQSLKWIYGTGLAEPRFSNTLKIKEDYDGF